MAGVRVAHKGARDLDLALGSPEGATPSQVLKSILSRARQAAGAKEVVLVVPPDIMWVFSQGCGDDVIPLAPKALLACDGPKAMPVLDADPSSVLETNEDGSVLVALTPNGGLIAHEPQLDIEGSRLELIHSLACFAGASVTWASEVAALEQRSSEIEQEQWALRDECARLRELADVDDLTGLYNRRFFDRHIAHELDRFRRYGHPLSLALVDVDRFKTINDTLGHAAGDTVLQHLADVFQDVTRSADYVARIGGDEFALLLPDTPLVGGLRAAERLLQRVHACKVDVGKPQPLAVSLSIGVASTTELPEVNVEDLISCADQALYSAKRDGRGRVAAFASSG